jgi:septal ring factor EnvC (AmiA/AmiB activator)
VAFAAPFRSFGLLMIVDCGGGTHFVLSGLFRIDAEVGQTLQPGEPVGIMPSWDPRTPGSSKPLLYVELRRNGVPVNPAPFLRSGS